MAPVAELLLISVAVAWSVSLWSCSLQLAIWSACLCVLEILILFSHSHRTNNQQQKRDQFSYRNAVTEIRELPRTLRSLVSCGQVYAEKPSSDKLPRTVQGVGRVEGGLALNTFALTTFTGVKVAEAAQTSKPEGEF
ncbi:hypothetical protein Anapl_18616 [Anas platyrhynchos]|uniref:Uncharacterized protein n=1 Tax=Anas platyrhynchos TaxID=8839 RepID=R0K0B6_ANAPL|nr:hypothetical protein Anapl_18616 [Anas platyrhynchos]